MAHHLDKLLHRLVHLGSLLRLMDSHLTSLSNKHRTANLLTTHTALHSNRMAKLLVNNRRMANHLASNLHMELPRPTTLAEHHHLHHSASLQVHPSVLRDGTLSMTKALSVGTT
jgi:hypothetical protein